MKDPGEKVRVDGSVRLQSPLLCVSFHTVKKTVAEVPAFAGIDDRIHGFSARQKGHMIERHLHKFRISFFDTESPVKAIVILQIILQIDVDAAEINKNIQTDASIIGDVKIILRKLNARLDPMNHDEWLSHIERLKDMYPLRYNKEVLTGPYIMEEIYKVTGGDAIICTDVGQHQMWAAQYYKYKRPRQLLTSGGLGTMGYGLGAAIGAKMGCKDKTVINIAGDGCFRMNMNEIATATRYNIPVIEVVFNNHVLGMVRQWQTLFYGKRYSQTELYDQMDFVKVAEGMGAKAYRITKKEDVEPVLREAISLNIPVMIECQIGSDDKVFPMVPAGKPIEEAFDEIDLRIE